MKDDVQAIGLVRIQEIVSSVPLLAVFGLLLIFFVSAVYRPSLRPWAVGLLVFLAMPSPSVDFWGKWLEPPFPMNTLVLYSRSVTAVLVLVMSGLLLFESTRTERFVVPKPLMWLFVMQIVLCLRLIFGDQSFLVEGTNRMVVYFLIFIGMGIALPTIFSSQNNPILPIKCLALAIVLYAACSFFIMVYDWDAGFRQTRWIGISGNPNHAGMIVALFIPALLGMIMLPTNAKSVRVGLISVLSFTVIILLLTGSRGALLTAMIGVVMFFRVRLGPLVVVAVPVAVLAMVLLQNLRGGNDVNLERIVSTENTREFIYGDAFKTFLENPIVGEGGSFNFVENAYLAYMMKTGIPGFVLMLIAGYTVITLIFQTLRVRNQLGPLAPIADASVAGAIAIAANSMIEATFLSNLSQTIFAIYLYVTAMHMCVHYQPAAVNPYVATQFAPQPSLQLRSRPFSV